MKYQINATVISTRLRALRLAKHLTQQEVAQKIHLGNGISRNSVSDWESNSEYAANRLPSLPQLIDLCNLYEVDLDYVLGATDLSSQDKQTMAQTLHLGEKQLNQLAAKPQTAVLIDHLVADPLLKDVVQGTKRLSQNQLIADVINTCLAPKFAKKIRGYFEDYYFNVLPLDLSEASFQAYLAEKITLKKMKQPTTFLKTNFLSDGQLFVRNQFDEFDQLPNCQQYEAIISSIAAIVYDYSVSAKVVILAKQQLTDKFGQILDHTINQLTAEYHDRIQAQLHKSE
ncbi:helix-turn-helix domain-containing protein [Lapidilactobacillus wuchangensis]|uniref:helix-turn-helix domain-containing protein n=1 Tax=Lapidilactobacillus wuchangensis TaxID=2486001 RepID=UPI000F7B1439|nr:helix-turn-helix transcriptional regulator [Lapidilactobacillus wuchangensis]